MARRKTRSLPDTATLVLIGGLSGAGKSSVIDILSDMGFYKIDNLPVPLFETFLETARLNQKKFAKTALLLDIDSRDKLAELMQALEKIDRKIFGLQFLYFTASNEAIIRRYSETRRPHPGFDPLRDKSLEDTIKRERNRLLPFRDMSHFSIDTTDFSIHDLKRELKRYVETLPVNVNKLVRVNFVSFGFKYGVPLDCDLIADVRFLANPHFIEKLREKSGLEAPVRRFVMKNRDAAAFIKKYADLLKFLLPRYVHEGKSYINIGIGCTGGRHRSVVIANALSKLVPAHEYLVSVKHRDI